MHGTSANLVLIYLGDTEWTQIPEIRKSACTGAYGPRAHSSDAHKGPLRLYQNIQVVYGPAGEAKVYRNSHFQAKYCLENGGLYKTLLLREILPSHWHGDYLRGT